MGIDRIQAQGEQRPQHERHDNAGVRNSDEGMGTAGQTGRAEVEPDEKHIEDDAELRDGFESGGDLAFGISVRGGDQQVSGFRPHGAEQRRSQRNARHDFTDDGGLTEITDQSAENETEADHRREGGDDVQDDVDLTRERLANRAGVRGGWRNDQMIAE